MSIPTPDPNLKARLEAAVGKELEGNDEIMALLTNARGQYKEIDVNGVIVKIRPVIPKKARHISDDMQKTEDRTLDLVEDTTYNLLAQMCVEAPYTNPETWKIVDDESGIAVDLLKKFFDVANDTSVKIKNFRTK